LGTSTVDWQVQNCTLMILSVLPARHKKLIGSHVTAWHCQLLI